MDVAVCDVQHRHRVCLTACGLRDAMQTQQTKPSTRDMRNVVADCCPTSTAAAR
jgi:hypothetical protein